ncbi:hypothetical protein, partial [Escherichia coli]|uniref:hypothetical protein n=1 Tax=Escherichia coli TaxID=562 RepID=UPI001F4A41BD
MGKKTIIAVTALALLGLGGGAYLELGGKAPAGTGEAATSVPISLRDFLAALAIAVVTVALARNLPGLLEVLVLQRLTLAQGSAYATTTLLSYAISGIGIVSALSTLG